MATVGVKGLNADDGCCRSVVVQGVYPCVTSVGVFW